MVQEGDLLVQIDPRPYQAALDQARAKKAQDEATLKNAQLDLKRYSTLAQQEYAPRQQLDTQQATVEQLTAQIKGDQANIDNAATQVSYTDIRAPLSGKTGFRLFTAPEEAIGQINSALAAATVPVMALSSDGTKVLAQGHLALVDNQVDQTSGTIRMKATFQNTDNALWPGLSVATRLLVETRKNVIVISNDAIQHGPNGLYAFVIGENNKVEMRNLKVGDEGATQTVITDGITTGDRVVVAGQYRLTPNAFVDPREANAPLPACDQQAINSSQKAP
jgi:multidrug efflux system membrane fusion protein